MKSVLLSHVRIGLLIVVALALTNPSDAQKGPGGAQAPALNVVMPLGIQRGTSLDLVLTGANLAEPTGFWTSIPGAKATIPTDNNNGKDAGKLLVKLEVPKDAPLGVHAVRLATSRGLSNLRLFCVDDLPQVVADGKNRVPEGARWCRCRAWWPARSPTKPATTTRSRRPPGSGSASRSLAGGSAVSSTRNSPSSTPAAGSWPTATTPPASRPTRA